MHHVQIDSNAAPGCMLDDATVTPPPQAFQSTTGGALIGESFWETKHKRPEVSLFSGLFVKQFTVDCTVSSSTHFEICDLSR